MEGATCMNTPTDRILIKDLMLRCVLGLSGEERREKQDVLINLVLWTDLRPAAASDSIEDTVDYSTLKKQIISLVEGSQYHLAETLADRIASLCLEQPAVQQVQVTVEKPTALRFAHSVGVEIIRSRSEPS
jgi:dihydroneopterin aldolase/D-erythro-7,8-dihydroneopterin triphosphate epimerase